MHALLTLLAPLLLASPTLAGRPAEPPRTAAPAPAAAAEAAPARQAGLHSEVGTGVTFSTGPADIPTSSFVGVGLRMQTGYVFPLGRHWRLGPMLGTGLSYASTTQQDGTKTSATALQVSLAPHLEYEISRVWSVSGTVGPAFVLVDRGSFMGPEMSIAFAERYHFRDVNRRVGLHYRFAYVPTFALDVPASGAGHLFMFTFGIVGGMP